ncbi:MAG TPA: hypothetical protein PLR18_03075 [bacterium]|nr:hypothetical protein [bacterium]
MMRLNLLADEAKQQIRKNTTIIALTNGLILLTITVAAVAVVFVASGQYLAHQVGGLRESGSSQEEERTGEINKKMAEVSQIQNNYIKWSQTLNDILLLIPEGIKVYRLEMDRDNQLLKISGLADTRDQYLLLENQLNEAEIIEKVSAPVSNLLKPKEIAFTLEAKLRLNN